MAKYITYVFCWPNGIPFYVGSGAEQRLRAGWYRNNAGVAEILSYLAKTGEKPKRLVIYFSSEKQARKLELELINLWGREIDGGLLANLRIGDRGGVQGRKISAEQIKKMQSARKPHTAKFKKFMSIRMKGNKYAKNIVWTKEAREKLSRAIKAGYAKSRKEGTGRYARHQG